jgi:hypothetical protein
MTEKEFAHNSAYSQSIMSVSGKRKNPRTQKFKMPWNVKASLKTRLSFLYNKVPSRNSKTDLFCYNFAPRQIR